MSKNSLFLFVYYISLSLSPHPIHLSFLPPSSLSPFLPPSFLLPPLSLSSHKPFPKAFPFIQPPNSFEYLRGASLCANPPREPPPPERRGRRRRSAQPKHCGDGKGYSSGEKSINIYFFQLCFVNHLRSSFVSSVLCLSAYVHVYFQCLLLYLFLHSPFIFVLLSVRLSLLFVVILINISLFLRLLTGAHAER